MCECFPVSDNRDRVRQGKIGGEKKALIQMMSLLLPEGVLFSAAPCWEGGTAHSKKKEYTEPKVEKFKAFSCLVQRAI